MSEYPSYLIHYGIEGQKWGVRRFQNEDGTYTSEGLERRKQMLKDYDEGKLQGAHVRREIKRLGRAGKTYARYNKQLAKSQNLANDKFNRVTERIKNDRKNGLNVSEKDIKKAIRYGTEVRKVDYIAKDPQEFYTRMHRIESASKIGAGAGTVAFGVPGGLATGIAFGSVAALVTNNKYQKHYNDVFEKARNETIADLKKHKII